MEVRSTHYNSPQKIFNKKPEINERAQKKMKNYKISSFNFILDEKKDDIIIKEINEKEKERELYTTEKDRNIVKHIYQKGNKKEEMWVMYDDDLMKNEEKPNENILLNKKTKNRCMEIGTQTEETEEIQNSYKNDKKNEMKAKLKMLRLIEKYSYQFIFNFLLKYFSQNYIDNYINFLSYKDINEEIIELIKEVGIQKLLSILLFIGNSRGEQINFYINQKKDDKNEEIVLLDNKEDKLKGDNNNIINLEENNIEIIDDNNFELEKEEEDRKISLIDKNNKEKYDKYINDNSIKMEKRNNSFVIDENDIKGYYAENNNKIYNVYYEKEDGKSNEGNNNIIILDEKNEKENNIKDITMIDYNEQNNKKDDKINNGKVKRRLKPILNSNFFVS